MGKSSSTSELSGFNLTYTIIIRRKTNMIDIPFSSRKTIQQTYLFASVLYVVRSPTRSQGILKNVQLKSNKEKLL